MSDDAEVTTVLTCDHSLPNEGQGQEDDIYKCTAPSQSVLALKTDTSTEGNP
jgi:hypothetical protein